MFYFFFIRILLGQNEYENRGQKPQLSMVTQLRPHLIPGADTPPRGSKYSMYPHVRVVWFRKPIKVWFSNQKPEILTRCLEPMSRLGVRRVGGLDTGSVRRRKQPQWVSTSPLALMELLWFARDPSCLSSKQGLPQLGSWLWVRSLR